MRKKPICQRALVRPTGFEPVTHSLEGCCSIQLSYERMLGTAGRTRTGTNPSVQGILSPSCLPISPQRHIVVIPIL